MITISVYLLPPLLANATVCKPQDVSRNYIKKLRMQLYFHKSLHENGRIKDYRNIEIYFNDNKELIVKCCDINNTAEAMFGDSGVEFFLNIDKTNISKIKTILHVRDDNSLLKFFHSKYSKKESSFENIMDFLKENNVDFNYSRW